MSLSEDHALPHWAQFN